MQELLPNTTYSLTQPERPSAEPRPAKHFVRSRSTPAFKIQDADVQVLRLLQGFRFLDLDQIMTLMPRNKRSWQRRLGYMFHAGLITRPPKQRDYLSPQRSIIYGLGNKGAELLAQRDGIDRGVFTNWQRRNREAGLAYIEHTLLIGRLRGALELATRLTPKVSLHAWESEGKQLNFSWKPAGSGDQLTIRPDAGFTLELAGRPNPFRTYLLEADRSTMAHKIFLPKLVAYWLGQKRYRKWLDVKQFRVLITTISEARRDNLRALARMVDNRGGSPMFLFSTERNEQTKDPERSYTMGDPASVLQPIWLCPVCPRWHSLTE